MKRTFVFLSFLIFLVSVTFANSTQIDLFQNPTPPGPKPLAINYSTASFSYYPVSAIINETDLEVYFDWSVGSATITVYDSTNLVVCQEVVNASSTTQTLIPVDLWGAGDYKIQITYGNTKLIGYFQIP
jgi:hypothetical protein